MLYSAVQQANHVHPGVAAQQLVSYREDEQQDKNGNTCIQENATGRPIAGGEKRKDKRSDIVLETKPKRFGIVPEFVLFENRLFRFGTESALLYQIKMISFDGADSGMNSDVMVWFLSWMSERLRNVCGTFVERLWNVCSLSVLTLQHNVVEKKELLYTVLVH